MAAYEMVHVTPGVGGYMRWRQITTWHAAPATLSEEDKRAWVRVVADTQHIDPTELYVYPLGIGNLPHDK